MAGASVPASVGSENVQAVGQMIKLSFGDTFKLIMIICAIMAWISAIAAGILIEPHLDVKNPLPQRIPPEEECCA